MIVQYKVLLVGYLRIELNQLPYESSMLPLHHKPLTWSRMRASNPRPAAFSLIATITLYQLQDRRATNCANPTYRVYCMIYLNCVIVECSVIKIMGSALAVHGLFY